MSNPVDQSATQFFYELTPEKILEAVEETGLRSTGRCLQMNSMENRVYEVEIEVDDESLLSPSERFRVVKFYRPGRWSREQILEEHQFLLDLKEAEVPVVAPLPFTDGATLRQARDTPILFSVFPKQGGRSPDEFAPGYAERIGRLLARVHAVGAQRKAEHRLALDVVTYGAGNLEYLLTSRSIPAQLESSFSSVVETLCKETAPLFASVVPQRIHGDCHFGNVLWRDGPFLIDFDDMVRGPCVQDLWLMMPGTDDDARRIMKELLNAYEEMRAFDRSSLRLIEPLRALRMVHFATWIARRYTDPAFQRVFPQFGSDEYWRGLLGDLNDQLEVIRAEQSGEIIWR